MTIPAVALALVLSLNIINTAKADVCFLPEGGCEDVNTKNFWPCVGSDCPDPSRCDASYNSRQAYNGCGVACTKCADADSPYYGLYNCPENTCNCDEYTSTEAYNECGVACSVCRITSDKNYGKYKCPEVPIGGCNAQCSDFTLTEEDECKDCEQCTNENAPADKKGLWKCTECDQNVYNHTKASLTDKQKADHCDESDTCGCYIKCDNCFGYEYTLQDCQDAGYDSAKNECTGMRGKVYESCCNTCNGYIYSSDLSKTSEGWSCTECPNSCDGGSKFSCGCKEGYHADGGNCVLNQCTSGVAENTCDPATHTFTSNNTSFTNTSGNTIRCGTCEENNVGNDDCSTWALWVMSNELGVSGAVDVTEEYRSEFGSDYKAYKTCLNDTVTFSIEPTDCMEVNYGWNIGSDSGVSTDTSFTFTMTQDFIDQYGIVTNDIVTNDNYNYVEFNFNSFGMTQASCETTYGTGECVENTSHSGCYEVCHTKSYCKSNLSSGQECVVSHTKYGRDCWEAQASNQATIYCDYYEQRYNNAQNWCDSNVFSNSVNAFDPCEVSYTVKANDTTICGGAGNASDPYGLTSTTITAGTYDLTVEYSGFLGSYQWVGGSMYGGGGTKCYKRYAPDILVVYDENPTSSFRCWQIGRREDGYHSPCNDTAESDCYVSSVEMRSEMSSNHYNSTHAEEYIFDNFIEPSEGVTADCPEETYSDYNLPSYTFEGGKTYYIRAGSVSGNTGSIHKCWYMDP